LKSGDQRRALEDALHALRLDPDQEETSLLLVRLYDESGRARDAARYLDAWVARAPASTPALRTLLAFAIRHGDRLRRERAEVGLQVMRRSPARVPGAQIPVYDALDGAIARGELSRARTLADDALLSPGALAVRAAALGFTDFAETQAEFVQAANPRDSDAWASTLLCADLLHDEPGFAQALLSRDLQLGSEPRVPAFDALTVRLLAELLDRRVGRDAARNWLRAYGRLPAARDPLERALDERIATFLAP
jgi:tetratricopeptide (TPR) repeat protein